MKNLKELPLEVQTKIIDTLGAYDRVNVHFENGCFHVRTSVCVQKYYPTDYKFINSFYYEDLKNMPEIIQSRKDFLLECSQCDMESFI